MVLAHINPDMSPEVNPADIMSCPARYNPEIFKIIK